MELIQSFIAIPEAAAKRQAQQLNTTSNLEAQPRSEKLEWKFLCLKQKKELEVASAKTECTLFPVDNSQ